MSEKKKGRSGAVYPSLCFFKVIHNSKSVVANVFFRTDYRFNYSFFKSFGFRRDARLVLIKPNPFNRISVGGNNISGTV